jgi:hypothetical protein
MTYLAFPHSQYEIQEAANGLEALTVFASAAGRNALQPTADG